MDIMLTVQFHKYELELKDDSADPAGDGVQTCEVLPRFDTPEVTLHLPTHPRNPYTTICHVSNYRARA